MLAVRYITADKELLTYNSSACDSSCFVSTASFNELDSTYQQSVTIQCILSHLVTL
jgi:hypothetical protein